MNNDLHLTHFFLCCVRWSVRCESFCFTEAQIKLNHTLQEFTTLPSLQRNMGESSRGSDTSRVDAEMNDIPYCDAQREQAKKALLNSSRVPPSVNLKLHLIFLKMHGVFTMFGDSDVQNGTILEHTSGLHVHHIVACIYCESHSVMKTHLSGIALVYFE